MPRAGKRMTKLLAYRKFQKLALYYNIEVGDVLTKDKIDRLKTMSLEQVITIVDMSMAYSKKGCKKKYCAPELIIEVLFDYHLLDFSEMMDFCAKYWMHKDLFKKKIAEKYPTYEDICPYMYRTANLSVASIEFYINEFLPPTISML